MAGRAGVWTRQILLGSLVTWALTGLLIACIHFFGGRSWADAAQLGCLFMVLLVLGFGAVGLGGGIVAVPSTVFRKLETEHRSRVEDDPGGLTPLGLALFVVPQLLAGAAFLGN